MFLSFYYMAALGYMSNITYNRLWEVYYKSLKENLFTKWMIYQIPVVLIGFQFRNMVINDYLSLLIKIIQHVFWLLLSSVSVSIASCYGVPAALMWYFARAKITPRHATGFCDYFRCSNSLIILPNLLLYGRYGASAKEFRSSHSEIF